MGDESRPRHQSRADSYKLLTNGFVVDGSGRPGKVCDVLIRGDRIVDIGKPDPPPDCEIVDCSSLCVAPGFIDVHSHSDKEVLELRSYKLEQGITTEIVGNCGYSLYPTRPNPSGIKLTGELFDGEPREGLESAKEYLEAVSEAKPLLNVASFTGHGALRIYAMQIRRNAEEDDLKRMEATLARCLETGSLGLSTGLNCIPGNFADSEELLRLGGVLSRFGGYYATHMRDYKFRVVEAVEESIEMAKAAEVPLQISHMQVVGKRSWPKLDVALETIEAARAAGVDIAMDAYPYLAGSCSLIQFLPEWCQQGGVKQMLSRLETQETFARIAEETDAYMSNTWDDIIVCGTARTQSQILIGKSIAGVAAIRERPAAETALELLREEDGYLQIISFNNNEDSLKTVLTHPLTSIETDGLAMEGLPHPRTFGSFPLFLGRYIRDKHWMSLEEAIVKTSSLGARRFGLRGRGTIAAGNFADIVIFDPKTINSHADYRNPDRKPEGIFHVMVNGYFGVRDAKLMGTRAGRVLLRVH